MRSLPKRAGAARIWLSRFGWAALAIGTLMVAAAPDLVELPEPEAAKVLSRATYQPDTGEGGEVSLPHAIYPRTSEHPSSVRYLIGFDLPNAPDKNLFLFIPSINRRIALVFNGDAFFGFESSELWTGPLVSASVMVRLPRLGIVGRNQLTVVVDTGPFAAPAYLSRIYLGTEAALAPSYKLRNFLNNQLKTMALAAQLLLGFGLIVAYFFRPKDPLFSWLATFTVVGFVVTIGLFMGWQPALQRIQPFTSVLIPSMGFLYVGVALALINRPPPNALRLVAIAAPCVLLPFPFIDIMFTRVIWATSVVAVSIATFVAAACIIAWGAFWKGNIDARLMLAPSFLLGWFAVRDAYVTANLPEHTFNLLFPYPRPLWLAFLTAVLMRRMGVSLNQFDRANETLAMKLAEREEELAILSRQERIEAARVTREQERQRLTHDLHDGLSGHLVSIIALSERAGDKSTEQAAREALNDLRLVIYSLDLGDRELPLALANFRERLIPQLHRLGVALDWSIVQLPEVSGVTPGNALAILRILQEAITNAVKHGPAHKIAVRGTAAADGMFVITVENDGHPFVELHRGYGMANMRRRAGQLHGSLKVEACRGGTRVTLLLPSCLPDFE
ncbi:MAG: histidine kinase, partial [Pseudolabrys sp.]|nr:histidine kinase [Pseudolabrys sp.]